MKTHRRELREWAKEYADRGLAFTRIQPGRKQPTHKRWTEKGVNPDAFRDGDNIGLLTGALSGDLVCVDLDSAEALAQADRLLPPTGMVGGRPGKPRSHRYYRVVDLDPQYTAGPHVAGGAGGPKTRHFGNVLDVQGTGAQAVEGPSVWFSQDGSRAERRCWHELGEPAVVDHAELYVRATLLAEVCGWREAKRPGRRPRAPRGRAEAPDLLPLPEGEVACQARAYLAKFPPAVEGQGGDAHTFRAACVLVLEFGLLAEEALPLLLEWNRRCEPPWTAEELEYKLQMAEGLVDDESGWRVRRRPVEVCLRGGPVYVGEGTAGPGRSYVDLARGLRGGHVGQGHGRRLAPELAAVDWRGREVVLAPASTVATNKGEVWDEYFMAYLLRDEGARVTSLRLPPLNGRRRTLAQADGTERVVTPPLNYQQVKAAAEAAGRLARQVDAQRRALPRRRRPGSEGWPPPA